MLKTKRLVELLKAKAGRRHVTIITGCTASGKSFFVERLAERYFNYTGGVRGAGEKRLAVINADSMQVYNALPITTAKPSESKFIDYHLYGFQSPELRYCAGAWAEDCATIVAKCQENGQAVVVVGGTGFYIKALLEGFSSVPPVKEDDIKEAEALFNKIGPEAFYEQLAIKDPSISGKIAKTDRQRLIRAYNVFKATGVSIITLQGTQKRPTLPGFEFTKIIINPSREKLYENINLRVKRMIEEGMEAEIRSFLQAGALSSLPIHRAIGVPEFADYFAGLRTKDETIDLIAQHTRNFAKRQSTWFRNQFKGFVGAESFS